MSNAVLYQVYAVLYKFTKSRKWQSVEDPVEQSEFNKSIVKSGFIIIDGIDANGQTTSIVLASPTSKVNSQTEMFKRVQRSTKSEIIILITDVVVTNNLRKYINSEKLVVYSYPIAQFLIDMRRAMGVPPHRILDVEETVDILSEMHKRRQDLPKIYVNDVQAVWLGAKVGDVIEIKRPSEVTGTSIYYRHVVSE